MEVRWLEDFLALARTRHFARAAEVQHVSQPTFSRRIKLLEEAMGSTLINRQTLPLSLTPAGEMFRELCERITRDVLDTRDRIAALEAEASARISVGSTQGLFSHFYQAWARDASIAERLQLNLNATSWVGEQFLEALDSGECDLVLCYWHPDLPWGGRWPKTDTNGWCWRGSRWCRSALLTTTDTPGLLCRAARNSRYRLLPTTAVVFSSRRSKVTLFGVG